MRGSRNYTLTSRGLGWRVCEIFALTPALSPRERGPLGATLGYTVKEEMIATNPGLPSGEPLKWVPAFAGMKV